LATTTTNKVRDWLIASKIISPEDEAYRVIIDIDINDPVRVYVCKYGTDPMFDIALPEGIDIVRVPQEAADA